jgi:pimeloyl-ACP methyl ester carboxylesterase
MLYNRFWKTDRKQIEEYSSNNEPLNDNLIVFVHGRNGNSHDYDTLLKNLRTIGVKNRLIAVNLMETGRTTIEEDARRLHEILVQFDDYNITLVGHSKAGITVLYYLVHYPKNIKKVITVSAPLNGTQIADYFLSKTHICRIQFGWQSSFTQDLIKSLPSNIPKYHIVPDWDHMIIPTLSARITGPNHRTKHYTGFKGHIGILSSFEVAQWIADWIKVEYE